MFRRSPLLKDQTFALRLGLILFGTLPLSSSAQTLLYWDADGASSSATGGTGSWVDNGTGFRIGSSTGTITGLNNNTSAVAVFEGTAGTVTLGTGSNPTVGGLSSNSSSYALALGANTLTINSGFTNTYRGNITGTGGLTKSGSGTQTLANNVSYTGDTTINGGTLQVGGFDMTSTDFILANTSGVNLSIPSASDLANGAGPYQNFATTVRIGSLSGGGANGGNVAVGHNAGLAVVTSETSTFAGNITGNGALSKAGSALQTFTGSVNGRSFTVSNGSGEVIIGNGATSGSLNISGGITVGENSTLAFNRSDAVSLGNNITGNGTFEQSGSGTLTLTGGVSVNTLNISNGTVAIGNGGTAGTLTSDATTNDGALIFNRSDDLTVAGDISGTGTLNKQGAGVLNLSGNNTYSGGTTVEAGTLRVSGGNAIGDTSWVFLNDTVGVALDLNGTNETIWSLAGGGSNGGNVALGSGTLTTGSQPTDTTFSGVISGSGGLVKVAGQNNFTLAGANTYSGSTTVTGGNLVISADNNLGAAPGSATPGHLTLNGGTLKTTASFTLNANRGVALGANDGTFEVGSGTTLTYGGMIAGTGNLVKTDTGALAVTGSANTYTGTTEVRAGTLQIGGGNAIGDSSAVVLSNVAGALLDLNDSNETIASLAGGGTTGGDVDLGSGTLTLGGDNSDTIFSGDITGTGTLVKTGSGSISLRGTNTYSGGTVLEGGYVNLFSAGAIGSTGTVTFSGGALEFQPANTTDYSSRFSTADNQAYRIHTSGNNVTFASDLTSSGGSLTKEGSGTLTLSGNNTFDGTTTVQVGTLALSGGNALSDSSAVTLSNTSGTTLLLNASETIGSLAGGGTTGGNVTLGSNRLTLGGDNTSTTFSGIISGTTGGVTKEGTGTFIMNNASVNYTGDTVVNAGTLQANQAAVPWSSTLVLADTVGAQFVVNFAGTEQLAGLSGGGSNGGNVVVNADATLQPGFNNASSTFAGAMSGEGNLNKIGTGNLEVTGTSSLSGTTTVTGGTLTASSTNAIGDSSAVTVNSGTTFDLNDVNETIGSLTGAGSVDLGSGTLTTGGNNANTTFSGAFSGTGGVTKAGTGNFTLTQQPGFSGSLTLNGGTVTLDSDSDYTAANEITGSGNLAKAGTGTITLSGTNSNSGTTTISAGTLRTSGGNALGDTSAVNIASGATLDLNNVAETVGTLTGSGTVTMGSANLTTNVDNGDATFAGGISGTGTLVKSGASTLTLSGTNSFSGGVNILSGGLRIGSGGATGGGFTGDIAIGAGAILVFDRSDDTTFSSVISGAGAINIAGAGTLALRGANTFTGALSLNNGTLNLFQSGSIGDTSEIFFGGGTLQHTANNTTDYSSRFVDVSNIFKIDTNGQDITWAADLNDSAHLLTKIGAGTLTLTGSNTFNGDGPAGKGISLAGGTLALGSVNAIGSLGEISFDGGSLQHSANNTTDYSSRFSTADNQAYAIDTNGQEVTLATALTSTGGTLTKSGDGNLILTADNTYSGTTTINGGTLTLGAGGNTGSVDGDIVTNSTLAINRNPSVVFNFASAVSGTGSVLINSGNVSTNNGSIEIDGDFTIESGIFQDSSNATKFDVDGTVDLQSGSLLSLRNASLTSNLGALQGAGQADITGSAIVGAANTSTTYSGTITNSGDWTKTGTGTLTLSGNNENHTGDWQINGGELAVTGGSAIDDNSAVTLADTSGVIFRLNDSETIGSLAGGGTTGGVVELGSNRLTLGGNNTSTTFQGGISGTTGGITKEGSGTLILQDNPTLNYTGDTIINGGTLQANSAAVPFGSSLVLADTAGAQFVVNFVGTEQFSGLSGGGSNGGDIVINAGGVLQPGFNDATSTFAGDISGAGALNKVGTGSLVLTGDATHTGGTTITAGAIDIGNGGITGSLAGNIANNSGLYFNRSNAFELSGNISGTGLVQQTGAGTTTLSGTNTYSGATNVTNGTVIASGGSAIGDGSAVTINSGATLDLNNTSETIGSLAGAGAVALGSGNLTTGGNNTSTVFSGGISGSGKLIKDGAGTFRLSGTNSFAGGADINEGTLIVGNGADDGGGFTGGIAISSGANLTFDRSDVASFSSVISGAGSVTQVGTGTIQLNGNNTFSGDTTLASGTIELGHANALGSVGTISFNGGTLLYGADAGDHSSRFSNAANQEFRIDVASQNVTYASDLVSTDGILVKSGTGSLTLSGTNTFSGATTVNRGVLNLSGGSALADSSAVTLANVAGTQLVLNASETIGSLAGGGTTGGNVNLGGNRLTLGGDNTSTTFSGVISGTTGGITKEGTGTFIMNNSSVNYDGNTIINGGTLQADAAAIPWSSNLVLADTAGAQFVVNFVGTEQFSGLSGGGNNGGNVIINAGGVLQPGFNDASSTFGGGISGAGALNKVGNGTLTLTGDATHTGGTTISAGTLALGDGGTTGSLAGDVTNNGALNFNRSNDVAASGIISGSGLVHHIGTGNTTLSGANTYSGTTIVSAGTLTAANNSALGSTASGTTVNSGATLALSGGISIGAESVSLTGTLQNAAGNNAFAGNVSGTGALNVAAGSLTLTGNAAQTGGNTIANGATLNIGDGGASGSLAGNTINNGALSFNTSSDLNYSGDLFGSGSLTKLNTNTLTLSGTNTYSGDTTVSAGTLRLGASDSLSANTTLTVESGATFDANGFVQSFENVTGAGNIGLGSGDLTVSPTGNTTFSGNLSGTGGIIKNGAGTLTLSGNNSYSGNTSLNSGTLAVSGNNAIGTGALRLNGGALNAAGASTLGNAISLNADTTISGSNALNLTGAVTLGGFKSLNVTNSAKTTLSGIIGDSSTSIFIKQGSGELELTGANTFTGGTLISGGTVRINNGSGSAFGTGAVTVANGATLTGAGSFTGALQLNGTYSPGNSPGTQNTGSQTWAGGASFIFEIDNATGTKGTNWDLLAITGTLTINATAANPFTINVDTLLNGTDTAGAMDNFDANTSHEWVFVETSGGINYGSNASIGASFAVNTDDFANPTNGTFTVTQIGNSLALTYSAVPEPGSFALLLGGLAMTFTLARRRRNT